MNKIESVLNISMDKIRVLADANTIVGTPMALPDGSTIIPISKVGLGLLTGGLDIPTQNVIKKSAQDANIETGEYPFAGTSALGIGLSPTAFVIINNDTIRLEPVEYNNSIDRLIDTLSPILEKIVCCCTEKNN